MLYVGVVFSSHFFQLHKYFIEITSTIISDVAEENENNGGLSEWSSFGSCMQKHDIEIVICPSHLKDDCHVMDTSQIQNVVKRMNVLVGTYNSVKSRIYHFYIRKNLYFMDYGTNYILFEWILHIYAPKMY